MEILFECKIFVVIVQSLEKYPHAYSFYNIHFLVICEKKERMKLHDETKWMFDEWKRLKNVI